MVTLTPAMVILRAGPDHCAYGDPFEFSAVAHVIEDTAWIIAGVGEFRPQYAKLFAVQAEEYGVRRVFWQRIGDDRVKIREFRISSGKLVPVRGAR